MPKYKPFGLEVEKLRDLEWANVTNAGQDGGTWIVREIGKDGYIFRVSLSDTQRNSTPPGSVPIERDEFPTPEDVRKGIRLAISDDLLSSAYESMERGKAYSIDLTCFDLYEAADEL